MNAIPIKYADVLGQVSLDNLHVDQAFEYYNKCYQTSSVAKRFVNTCSRIDNILKSNPDIGYCDRTMGRRIPKARSPEGAAIWGSLRRSGLVRASGHELFRGCVVVPTYNDMGNVISAVGYRLGRIRKGDRPVVHWGKPEPKAFVYVGMSLAKELIHGQAFH